VRRPDRLRIAVHGDVENRELYYDGETVSVFNNGYYASTRKGTAVIRFPVQHPRSADLGGGRMAEPKKPQNPVRVFGPSSVEKVSRRPTARVCRAERALTDVLLHKAFVRKRATVLE